MVRREDAVGHIVKRSNKLYKYAINSLTNTKPVYKKSHTHTHTKIRDNNNKFSHIEPCCTEAVVRHKHKLVINAFVFLYFCRRILSRVGCV
jgi:hypothetical protein